MRTEEWPNDKGIRATTPITNQTFGIQGGAIAEWSKALVQSKEKINENQKISGSPPRPDILKMFEILTD